MINLIKKFIGICLFLVPAGIVVAITYFFGLWGLAVCVIVEMYWLFANTFNNTDTTAYTRDTDSPPTPQAYPEWKTGKLSLSEEVMYENALNALKETPASIAQLNIIAAFLNARLAKRFDFSSYTRDQLDFCIRQAYNAANSDTYEFNDLTIE